MRTKHHNPLHIVAVAGLVMVLVAAYHDPDLSRYVVHWPSSAVADAGKTATDVVGQVDGADTAYYTSDDQDNYPNARSVGISYGMALDPVRHRLFATSLTGVGGRILIFNLDSSNGFSGTDRVADAVLGAPDSKTVLTGTDASTFNGDIYDLVYDSDNDLLFVTDRGNSRVLVFDVSTVTNNENAVYVIGADDFTTMGGGTTDDTFNWGGGYAMQLELDTPNDRLFVADNDNNRILVFDVSLANLASEATGATDGISINADYVLGQPDFTSSILTNPPTQDTLALPSGLSFLSSGSQDVLFVADSSNHRVVVFNVTPGTISNGMNAMRVLGQAGYITDGSGNSDSQMTFPVSVAVTADKRLFVSERDNNRVTLYDVASITNGEPAQNVLGQEAFGSSVAATTIDGLSGPQNIDYDAVSDTLFVQDANNGRIVVYDVAAVSNGENAVDAIGILDENDQPVYTISSSTPNAQGIFDPAAAELDSTNHRLFVSDSSNNRVLMFELDATDNLLDHTADAVLGQSDVHSNAAATTQATFNYPWGLAFDAANNRLFVGDLNNNRVMVFDVTTVANGENATNVIGQTDFVSTLATVDQTHLSAVAEVAYDSTTDRLFVTDSGHNRIMVFDVDPAVLVPNVTNGPLAINELGQDDSDESGDYYDTSAAATTPKGMSGSTGVAVDESGQRLFVADSGNLRVTVFNIDESVLIPDDNPANGSNGPNALRVLGQEDLYTNTDCTTRYGNPEADCFAILNGIGYDQTGNRLFVPDTDNNRVLMFAVASGSFADGDAATDVWGQTDFVSNALQTTQDGFYNPTGATYAGGTLYVADAANNRIMIFGSSAPTPTPGGQIGNPVYYPPGYTGFFPIRITVNDDDSSTDTRNVFVQVYADFTDSFTGTVDLMLSNVPDFSTFLPFRYMINNAASDRLAWPKTISWDLCFGLPSNQPCDPGQKTVYARFYPNIPQPTPARSPIMPSRSVSPTPTPSPTPAQTTIIPQPVCPTSCRQLGLYDPGEVTGDGCTHSGSVYGYNNCLKSDRSVGCKTIHRAAGPTCYVPNQHTNYCFRCP